MDGITGKIRDADYAHHAIIKPPSEFVGDHQSQHRIVIDSRLRDRTLFPRPDRYDIRLEDDITDVIRAQLVYLDLPPSVSSRYLVDAYFHSLYVATGSSVVAVRLDEGVYDTAADLETQLQVHLAASAASAVSVAYVPRLDRFRWTSPAPFGLRHVDRPAHLALLFGLDPDRDVDAVLDATSGLYVLTAPYRWNPAYNDYVVMVIDDFGMLSSIDPRLNNAFTVASRTTRYQQLDIADRPEYVKRFSPPIARLTRLRVSFFDRFGNPVDFSNQDNRFELSITSLKQARRYGNVFAEG